VQICSYVVVVVVVVVLATSAIKLSVPATHFFAN